MFDVKFSFKDVRYRFPDRLVYFSFACALLFGNGCREEAESPQPIPEPPKTSNVVILVIDGPRWSETWGDTVDRIPFRRQLLQEGVFFEDFSNAGATHTTAGHVAVTTGFYQNIQNNGTELPAHPGIFQLFRKHHQADSTSCWVITSKDKLAVLANSNDTNFHNTFQASTSCGISGLGTGTREDDITLSLALQYLDLYHPRLVLIQFKEPDVLAHAGNWAGYLSKIHETDSLAGLIWAFISTHPFYKDQTSFFITNDHGRHPDSVADGFRSHGDGCAGCRKIECVGAGPKIKSGFVVSGSYNQTDLFATVAYLLDVPVDTTQGRVVTEILKP